MNVDNKKYSLGLVLSGGGARGFAHLGVMQALIEHNIKPDVISGTSAGALAGVFIADGHTPREVLSFFNKKSFREFGEVTLPQTGFFKINRFLKFLEKHLTATSFEELKIPLIATATDIERGKSKAFSSGPLYSAIVASCCVPIVFTPIEINNRHYVDGGLFKNFPVSTIRSQCKTIIGANVSPLTLTDYKDSLVYIAERSYHYLSVSNTFLDSNLCDYLLEFAGFTKYGMFDLDHIHELYQLGYDFTIKYIGEHMEQLEESFPQFKCPRLK